MLAKQLFDFLNVKSCCDILTIYFCPEQTDTPFKLITRLQSLEDVINWHKATFFQNFLSVPWGDTQIRNDTVSIS